MAPVTWGVADVGQRRANHWKSPLELETLDSGLLVCYYTQTNFGGKKNNVCREVKLLNGWVSHHQSCMNSAVDLRPANGVKHTVRSLPCVHHETSVFSVRCIIKKSHEALVGHCCSHIPFRCPAFLLDPLFFLFFFYASGFTLRSWMDTVAPQTVSMWGRRDLAGCWASLKSKNKHTLCYYGFHVFYMIFFQNKCKLWLFLTFLVRLKIGQKKRR